MDACETYARQRTKKEDVELDTLSEWIKSIGDVVKCRIRRLKHSVNTRSESIFVSDPYVVRELSRLHENFVIVSADKASNNYTFVCKTHYVDILIEKLGIHINIDSLLVPQSVRPSLYPFYSQNCLHLLSKVFRSTGRQPT